MRTFTHITTGLLCLLLPLLSHAQTTDWKALTRYDKADIKKQLTDRLLQYVAVDTQAQFTKTLPSTAGQLKLAKALAKELKKNGATQVTVGKNAVVTAEIPANTSQAVPTIALIGHLDTSPQLSGKDVRPQVVTNYKGGDLVIQAEKSLVLNTYNSPHLARARGHDIVTASGDTLLGAHSKAGLSIILTLAQFLYDHPQLPHGPIKIAFLPDSFSGAGARAFDVASWGADYAYTLDGGELGQLAEESFAAKTFTATFEGDRQVDLGNAINSSFADNVLMASDFHTLLPRTKRPETTAYRNGFIYVDTISTQGNRTEVSGLLRAFSKEEMQALQNEVTQAFNTVKNINYKGKNFSLTFTDREQNMKNDLLQKPLQLAQQAMQAEEVSPQAVAVRRTTDAALLGAKGLPTVGLFTGYYHADSLLEHADIDVMEASFRTVLRLINSTAK